MLDRLEILIGEENIKKIQKLKILIIGLGGVGSYTLEALVRSGVKDITIIDGDVVDVSNINRQLIALHSTVNESKTRVSSNRMKDINPDINIVEINKHLDEADVYNLSKEFDYIIDACDTIAVKKALISFAYSNNIKIISSMGMGKRLNPSLVKIDTIEHTINDPLAREIRKYCKNQNVRKIKVVFSTEKPLNTIGIGSCSFVPSVAGLHIASFIINDVIKIDELK